MIYPAFPLKQIIQHSFSYILIQFNSKHFFNKGHFDQI